MPINAHMRPKLVPPSISANNDVLEANKKTIEIAKIVLV